MHLSSATVMPVYPNKQHSQKPTRQFANHSLPYVFRTARHSFWSGLRNLCPSAARNLPSVQKLQLNVCSRTLQHGNIKKLAEIIQIIFSLCSVHSTLHCVGHVTHRPTTTFHTASGTYSGDTKWLPDMTAPENAALFVTLEMKASKIKTKNKTKLYLPSSPSSPKGQNKATAKLMNTARLKEMLPQREMCLENQNRAGLSGKGRKAAISELKASRNSISNGPKGTKYRLMQKICRSLKLTKMGKY